jgi:hypothetical protein
MNLGELPARVIVDAACISSPDFGPARAAIGIFVDTDCSEDVLAISDVDAVIE